MTLPRLLPFMVLLLFSYSLSAQSALRDGKDYAIFFYCTSFDEGWTALPETEEEVKAIGNLLQSDYGFQPYYVKNPTKADIKNEITKWNARVRPNDQVLYFFSTHGYYDAAADEGFLVPYNGKLRDTYGDTWLSYAELGRRVTKCRSKHVLLALDACYSGAFGDRYKGQPDGTPWEADADCADQVENALAYPTRRYFTSGSKNQRTPARSLFARRWLTALRKGQEKGVVRIRDLRYHLGSIPNPKPEDGSFTGHEDGGFVFVHRSACQGSGSGGTDAAEEQLWAQAQRLKTKEAYAFYLQVHPNGRYRAQAEAKIKPFEQGETTTLPSPTRRRDLPDMIFVEGGTFTMGSDDSDAESNETPHRVSVDDFYMHRFEVTNEEFAAFLNAKGRHEYNDAGWYDLDDKDARIEQRGGTYTTKGSYGKHPVTEVTWYGAVAYCNWKSEELNLQPVYQISGTSVSVDWNANGFRLPTEAEWEFAARSRGGSDKWAGTSSASSLSLYANSSGSEDGYENTAPVGSFRPNGLGLKDMSGNVVEWCWDWYDGDYYKNSPSRNPRGPSKLIHRVPRGGSWIGEPISLRCTKRNSFSPSNSGSGLGFRLSRTAE
jgi:formylglycine-generating enzyme required for sulfatase activity